MKAIITEIVPNLEYQDDGTVLIGWDVQPAWQDQARAFSLQSRQDHGDWEEIKRIAYDPGRKVGSYLVEVKSGMGYRVQVLGQEVLE